MTKYSYKNILLSLTLALPLASAMQGIAGGEFSTIARQVSQLEREINEKIPARMFQGYNIFTVNIASIDNWYPFIDQSVLGFAANRISVYPAKETVSVQKLDKEFNSTINGLSDVANEIKRMMLFVDRMRMAGKGQREMIRPFKDQGFETSLSKARRVLSESQNKLTKIILPSYTEQAQSIIPAQIETLETEVVRISDKKNKGSGFYLTPANRQKAVDDKLRTMYAKKNTIKHIINIKQPIIHLCLVLAEALDKAINRIVSDFNDTQRLEASYHN